MRLEPVPRELLEALAAKAEKPKALPGPGAEPKQQLKFNGKSASAVSRPDDEVIAELLSKKKYADMWSGQWKEQHPGWTHSEADLSLLSQLKSLTGENAVQMDRIFRRSGLMRKKWDREDYREHTIRKALSKPGPKQAKTRPKQSTILAGLCEDHVVELFHTRDLRNFAVVSVNGHREIWAVRSQSLRSWMVKRFYEAEGKAPSGDAIKEMQDIFCARAQFNGGEREVGTRVLRAGEKLYLNLANDQWQAIEIQNSQWRIVPESPAYFIRPPGMGALPIPASDGSLQELKNLLLIDDDQFVLLVAWLLSVLHPEGPYPVLVIRGEHGSAKTTLVRTLRRLVDAFVPGLRTVPRDERDLVIAARNSWIIAIDNLSCVPQWLSDAFCRLATGGGLATRKLYTDDEEALFDAKRPIILNGIEDIARSPDLADRAIFLTLPPLPKEKRLTEEDYWQKFEQAWPSLLGGLLNAVAAAHGNISHTKISNPPRMADFANWVCAAAGPALGFTAETFLKVYEANRSEAISSTIESSALASAVQALVAAAPEEKWEGTYGTLLEALHPYASEETRKSKSWPKNARWLSSALRKFSSPLREAGCAITELSKDSKTRRSRIGIQKIGPNSWVQEDL